MNHLFAITLYFFKINWIILRRCHYIFSAYKWKTVSQFLLAIYFFPDNKKAKFYNSKSVALEIDWIFQPLVLKLLNLFETRKTLLTLDLEEKEGIFHHFESKLCQPFADPDNKTEECKIISPSIWVSGRERTGSLVGGEFGIRTKARLNNGTAAERRIIFSDLLLFLRSGFCYKYGSALLR